MEDINKTRNAIWAVCFIIVINIGTILGQFMLINNISKVGTFHTVLVTTVLIMDIGFIAMQMLILRVLKDKNF